jgi:ketosteroid isomerase-like protein
LDLRSGFVWEELKDEALEAAGLRE